MVAKAPGARCDDCPLKDALYIGARVYEPTDGPYSFAFIGESGGREEALQRTPLVGASGQVLMSLLAHLGVKNAIFGNVVLCYASGGKPTASAALCCSGAVTKLFNKVPRVLLMGDFAMQSVLGLTGITAHSGRFVEYKGKWFMPTKHPAAHLRAPNDFRDFVIDVTKFVRDGPWVETHEAIPETEYELVSEPQRLADILRTHNINDVPYVFDLETAGYDRYRDEILACVFCFEPGQAVVVTEEGMRDPRIHQVLRDYIPGSKYMGHNIKFDTAFLAAQCGIGFPPAFWDTMLAHYADDERGGTHELKGLCSKIFDIPDWEKEPGGIRDYLPKLSASFRIIPRHVLYKYAARDADITLRLAHWQWMHYDQRVHDLHNNLLLPFANALVETESHGVLIDTQLRSDQIDEVSEGLELAEADLRNATQNAVFNPASPQQCSHYLYDVFMFPVPRSGRSSDKEALAMLEAKYPGHPFIKALQRWRKLSKLLSTYIVPLGAQTGPDGRVRTTFKVHGTVVGRLSSADPLNLQNLARAYDAKRLNLPVIRDLLVSSPGRVFLSVDYSQMELRVMAALSNDPFMIKSFSEGLDFHSEVAIAMFGPNFTKEQRMMTKMFNFAWAYGGSEWSFALDAGLPIDLAKAFVQKYNVVMARAVAWKLEVLDHIRSCGYVEAPTGRRRHWPLVTPVNVNEARKEGPHAPVAGTASDCTAESLAVMQPVLRGVADIVMTVHDSIIMEVAPRDVYDVAHYVRGVMEETPYKWLPNRSIKYPVDFEIGVRFGSIKELEVL